MVEQLSNEDVFRRTAMGLMTTGERDRWFANQAGVGVTPQQPATSLNDNIGGGITRAQNQQKGRELGYTGDYGSGGFDKYLSSNPGKYSDYVSWRRGIDQSYTPHIDMNTTAPGTQSYGAPINSWIGSQIGYFGPVGSGQLGSGKEGDYLQKNPNYIDTYERMRRVFDPSYAYSGARPQQAAPTQKPVDMYTPMAAQPTAPSSRSKPAASTLPTSLADLQNLSDIQRRAAIATDALYGQGSDKEQQDYYLNMLQRAFMDESGGVQQTELLPVESQYLQALGLPFQSGQDFLDAVARRYAS